MVTIPATKQQQQRFSTLGQFAQHILSSLDKNNSSSEQQQQQQPRSVLVIGQGGGADAHGAYALAAALADAQLCAGDRVFYATVKHKPFANDAFKREGAGGEAAADKDGLNNKRDHRDNDANCNDDGSVDELDYHSAWRPDDDASNHVYLGGEVFEVSEDTSRTTLEHFVSGHRSRNEDEKNQIPAWVGTTWYEAAMPHERKCTGATCPLVCHLAFPLPRGHPGRERSAQLCAMQHARLAEGLAKLAPPAADEADADTSDERLPKRAAGRSWDLVIGLDHGGDAFIGGAVQVEHSCHIA
jgi:hypothetical protein